MVGGFSTRCGGGFGGWVGLSWVRKGGVSECLRTPTSLTQLNMEVEPPSSQLPPSQNEDFLRFLYHALASRSFEVSELAKWMAIYRTEQMHDWAQRLFAKTRRVCDLAFAQLDLWMRTDIQVATALFRQCVVGDDRWRDVLRYYQHLTNWYYHPTMAHQHPLIIHGRRWMVDQLRQEVEEGSTTSRVARWIPHETSKEPEFAALVALLFAGVVTEEACAEDGHWWGEVRLVATGVWVDKGQWVCLAKRTGAFATLRKTLRLVHGGPPPLPSTNPLPSSTPPPPSPISPLLHGGMIPMCRLTKDQTAIREMAWSLANQSFLRGYFNERQFHSVSEVTQSEFEQMNVSVKPDFDACWYLVTHELQQWQKIHGPKARFPHPSLYLFYVTNDPKVTPTLMEPEFARMRKLQSSYRQRGWPTPKILVWQRSPTGTFPRRLLTNQDGVFFVQGSMAELDALFHTRGPEVLERFVPEDLIAESLGGDRLACEVKSTLHAPGEPVPFRINLPREETALYFIRKRIRLRKELRKMKQVD